MFFLHFVTALLLMGLGTGLFFLFLYMRVVGSVAVIEESMWIWGVEVGLWLICIVIGVLSAVNIAFKRKRYSNHKNRVEQRQSHVTQVKNLKKNAR